MAPPTEAGKLVMAITARSSLSLSSGGSPTRTVELFVSPLVQTQKKRRAFCAIASGRTSSERATTAILLFIKKLFSGNSKEREDGKIVG